MSNIQPSLDFHNAAGYLSSASSLVGVSTSTKLELYGLFKYLTSSRMPSNSRPSIFDMTARAKWDAWAAAGKKYENPDDVEQRYLAIARSLGWTALAKIQAKPETKPLSTEEEIWDSDGQGGRSEDGSGMGFHVSSMVAPPNVIDRSLHGFALSNDILGISALLLECPETDLNALDEFGYAPIHLACDRGNTEAVKLLLERGADRNVKDPDNLSPLELSQEAGHTEIENLLAYSP